MLLGDGGERRVPTQRLATTEMLCSTSCFRLQNVEVLSNVP